MHISDDGEEGGGVKWRTSRIRQVSYSQDMPPEQGVVVHVSCESWGGSLGQKVWMSMAIALHLTLCTPNPPAEVSLYMIISCGLMRVSWYSHPFT